MLRAPRRRAGLRVPRARRTGRQARRRDGRRACRRRRSAPRPGGLRRSGRRPVRLLHARSGGRGQRPARSKPDPSEDEVREALSGNVCRCTGYVRSSTPCGSPRSGDERRRATDAASRRQGRRRLLRDDAVPKVKGEFAYSSDLSAPGMLWGDTLPQPARARPDRVARHRSCARPAGRPRGAHVRRRPRSQDVRARVLGQPVLAIDRVRYVGEPIALVAAEHPEQARQALEAIAVEYEPLEPVVDHGRCAFERGRCTPTGRRWGTATGTIHVRTSSATW